MCYRIQADSKGSGIFSIKRMGKFILQYPLLYINIHKGTKEPISVNQNHQPADIIGYNVRYFREGDMC